MKEPLHPAWNVAIYGVSFIGIFFILAGLIAIMRSYSQPPPPDSDYWALRSRNLSELNAQNKDMLQNYGWIDAGRGVARIPIAKAMELTVREWQNPAMGRSNLLARIDKMAPPTPVLPGTNAPAGATNGPAKAATTNAAAGPTSK